MHCVSRIVDKQYLMQAEEREVFVGMMRMYEEFCGVRVISYCVMSNHFHILLEIPPKQEDVELSDEEFIAKLSTIYSDGYVHEVKKLMRELRKNQAVKAMRELKAKYTYRMGDMSEFMKSLKQRFTQWYNKKHGRRGTLWEERYSATAVGAGSAAKTVAAYIDLNPLRAGIVDDPKDYRWSSYGEAVAGKSEAAEAYRYLMRMSDRAGASVADLSATESLERYRMLMAEEGETSDPASQPMREGQSAEKTLKRRRGYSREEIEKILNKNGKLSRTELLRCKTRYFTDGMVIGTKDYVKNFHERVKDQIAGDRKTAASPLRRVQQQRVGKVETGKLYSYRNLQKDIYG